MAVTNTARTTAEEALLDAAERLLVDVGHGGITTRRLAEEAGVNNGLVHYYFGSIENLLVRVLERFTDRLIVRQRAMYADPDVPFIEKWRTAMRYLLSEDVAYEKVWFELQALAWNRPELRERVDHVNAEWRAGAHRGVRGAAQALRDRDAAGRARLARDHVQRGDHPRTAVRRRGGSRELLDWIDGWMEAKEKQWQRRKR